MDRFSKEERSRLMSKIRSSNTEFEKHFIKSLRKRIRFKFSTHIREIKGTPDLVFFKKRVCVFLDSDFWHGWQYPRWKNNLKNDFWRNKIEKNRKRDRITTSYLRKEGWTVVRIWQHLIEKDIDTALKKVIEHL